MANLKKATVIFKIFSNLLYLLNKYKQHLPKVLSLRISSGLKSVAMFCRFYLIC